MRNYLKMEDCELHFKRYGEFMRGGLINSDKLSNDFALSIIGYIIFVNVDKI